MGTLRLKEKEKMSNLSNSPTVWIYYDYDYFALINNNDPTTNMDRNIKRHTDIQTQHRFTGLIQKLR